MKFILDGKELKVGDTLYALDTESRYYGNTRVIEKRVARLGRKYIYICNLFPGGRMAERVECRAAENKTWIVPSHLFTLHKNRWEIEKKLRADIREIRLAIEEIERTAWRFTHGQIAALRAVLPPIVQKLRNPEGGKKT